jgi:hypothetical protein
MAKITSSVKKYPMRITISFLLLGLGMTSLAQDDIYPDNRNKKESFLKVKDQAIRADLATFTITGIVDRIGKDPLKKMPPVNYGPNFLAFEDKGYKVTITAGKFEPEKHKLAYYDEKHLIKIDNKPYYGNYGQVPVTTIASVTAIIDKDTVAIPATALFDLYSPVFTYSEGGTTKTHCGVYFSKDSRTMYIYMLNKETIGNYEVTWVIQDKKYLYRVVDSGILR